MKILHLETGQHLYGGPQQVVYLIEALRRKGVQNVLVCCEGSAIIDVAAPYADEVHTVPMEGDLDLSFVRKFRRLVRDEQPDVVHLHSRRGADTLGAWAARRAGARVVMSRRVDRPEPRLSLLLKYRLFDRVIAVSDFIRSYLVESGVPVEKVVRIHDAVDRRLFKPQGDMAWFQREFRLRQGQRVIAVIAQLIERKGHRYLLEAMPAMLNEFPDLRLLVLGQGPSEADLMDQIKQMKLRGCVTLDGFRDDLPRFVACLDAVVHPALSEGLGVALLQAASCAVPIIASSVGGVPELVREGENGLLVPPRDSQALADAVCRVLREPEFAKALGERGRAIVDAEFSISQMCSDHLQVYEDVIKSRRVA